MDATYRIEDVARAVAQKNVSFLLKVIFDQEKKQVQTGFRTENELWEFKADCPHLQKTEDNLKAWAEISKDILALHNRRGGVIFFGITNDFKFCGATPLVDSKLFNDKIRGHLGDRIWVDFHREIPQHDQRYLGVAIIPPRGPALEFFKNDAPLCGGKRCFLRGETAVREGDSSRLLTREEAEALARRIDTPTLGRTYIVDEPFFRILAPEYHEFVPRAEPCDRVEKALRDQRTAVTSILGLGGIGKTALATWAVVNAYENKTFDFIASVTAKDRELTSTGIKALNPGLTSFESLLNAILEVLGFPDLLKLGLDEKEAEVRKLLEKSNGLLFVDNLETVDDARIIEFLDELPIGCKAITTSRRTSVRTSVYPVKLERLTDSEVHAIIKSFQGLRECAYLSNITAKDAIHIGDNCDRIPLAVRWVLTRARSIPEALTMSDGLLGSGRRGEELLEFSFRRVYEEMTGDEKTALQVLSQFTQPRPSEVILVGSGLRQQIVEDALEDLSGDAFIQKQFDPERNDYCYSLFPITRAFVYSQVQRDSSLEDKIRHRLSNYFDALDVHEEGERIAVREIRQGKASSEQALIDLGVAAHRRGDIDSAQGLWEQAQHRNPRSWKVAKFLAELHRHQRKNKAEAIRLYEKAASYAPRTGNERALIFREWGMLIRESGDINASDQSIEKFEEALRHNPTDIVTRTALAQVCARQGNHIKVIDLVGKFIDYANPTTLRIILPLLEQAYTRLNDPLNIQIIKERRKKTGY